MDQLTVREFETKFNQSFNLYGWVYGGKKLELESAADDLTKIMNQMKFGLI